MNGLTLLRCICEETRFNILELLQKNKELSVNDLVSKLKKDQPLVSHHLKALKECKIVSSKENGKSSIYFIANKEVAQLIHNIAIAGKKMASVCDNPALCNC